MASSTNVSSLSSVGVSQATVISSFQSLASYLSIVPSRFSSLIKQMTQIISSYASIPVYMTLTNSQNRVFVLDGNSIFSTDSLGVVTNLGFIPATDPQTLVDVPLADGFYELAVRPSGTYWKEARGKKILTVSILAGVVEFSGIPLIKNLTSTVLNNFKTRVIWDSSDEFNLQATSFGLWRSPTTPVVVTGSPDFTIPITAGVGRYSQDIQQTADEFVAVAAFDATDQATESEIFLPWDTTAPDSPHEQFAT